MKNIIKVEHWETHDEFIITLNDKPIGGTVREKTGLMIKQWLDEGGLSEIVKNYIDLTSEK